MLSDTVVWYPPVPCKGNPWSIFVSDVWLTFCTVDFIFFPIPFIIYVIPTERIFFFLLTEITLKINKCLGFEVRGGFCTNAGNISKKLI